MNRTRTNTISKMKRILLMAILLIASTILSYKVYAAKTIYIVSGGKIVQTTSISPGSLFCFNHGLHSTSYYKYSSKVDLSNKTDKESVMLRYIFSYYPGSDGTWKTWSAKQNAIWGVRSTFHPKSCDSVAYNSLYNAAETYYEFVSKVGKQSEVFEETEKSKKYIENGKYSIQYGVSTTVAKFSTRTEDESSTVKIKMSKASDTPIKKDATINIIDENDKTTTGKYDLYEAEITFDSDAKAKASKASEVSLYVEERESSDGDADGEERFTEPVKCKDTRKFFTKSDINGTKKLAKVFYIPKVGFVYQQTDNTYEKVKTKAKLELIKRSTTVKESSYLEYGAHPSTPTDDKFIYITSLELVNGKKTVRKITDKSQIEKIVTNNFVLNDLTEEEYEQKLDLRINYSYYLVKGSYVSYQACTYSGKSVSNKQTLVNPDGSREWKDGSELIEGPEGGSTSLRIKIVKLDGADVSKLTTKKNSLNGATFKIEKGYISGVTSYSDVAKMSYDSIKFKAFTGESKAYTKEINGKDTASFVFDDIPITTTDIGNTYCLFKVTETKTPKNYDAVKDFYILGQVDNAKSEDGKTQSYALRNIIVIKDESNADMIKFCIKGTDGNEHLDKIGDPSDNIGIKVGNIRGGVGRLELLKYDSSEKGINGINFRVNAKTFDSDGKELSSNTTSNVTEKAKFILKSGDAETKQDGVINVEEVIGGVSKIKFTINEELTEEQKKSLTEVDKFNIEFGVKYYESKYIISKNYSSEQKNGFMYNGKFVNFDKNDSYTDGNITITLINAGTTDSLIQVLVKNDSTAFEFELNKGDVDVDDITVEGATFDVKIVKVDKSGKETSLYENKELKTNKDGSFDDEALKLIPLKDVDAANETLKFYITETAAPETYELINEGKTFSFTASLKDVDGKVVIDKVIDKQDWPSEEGKGVVDEPKIEDNKIYLNVKDKFIDQDNYEIEIQKKDAVTDELIKNSEAKFEVKVNDGEAQELTTEEGIIKISDIKHENKNQKIEIRETQAPEGYELIKEGEWFNLELTVEKTESGSYRITEIKKDEWPSDATADLVDGNRIVIGAEDTPIGETTITLNKTNEDGEKLKGAKFKITVNGKEYEETTEDSGVITVPCSITDDIIEVKVLEEEAPTYTKEDGSQEAYAKINGGTEFTITAKAEKQSGKLVLSDVKTEGLTDESVTVNASENGLEINAIDKKTEITGGAQLTINKNFKNDTGSEARSVSFDITDMGTSETQTVNVAGTGTYDIKLRAGDIKLKIKETSNNDGWGKIPEFYLTFKGKEDGTAIDSSFTPVMEAVNESDKAEFDAIKGSLLQAKLSENALGITLDVINAAEGKIKFGLSKTDKITSEAMAGVMFDFTISPYGEEASKTIRVVTDANGNLEVPDIPVSSATGYITVKIHELTFQEGNTAVKYYKQLDDITLILDKGFSNQVYTVGGVREISNKDITYDLSGNEDYKTLNLSIANERRIMRLTGQVWEDVPSSGKITEVDGRKGDGEIFLNGVTVKLHTSNETDILEKYSTLVETTEKVTATVDGKEGYYFYDVPMYDGGYYVEFIYNGYRYQHTLYTPWDGQAVFSNATETAGDRAALNAKYETITKDSVSNKINDTIPTQTVYNENGKDYEIGISAYSGGFGKDKLTVFSAMKYDATEGKAVIQTNAANLLNPAQSNVTIGDRFYDYVFDNIDLGITLRETVSMGMAKSVHNVELIQEGGTNQNYEGSDYNASQLEPDASVASKSGGAFVQTQNENMQKAENAADFVGDYNVGVRVEDEYTTGANDPTAAAKDVKTYVTYKLALYNYSSQIGLQFNELVDYYDSSYTFVSAKDKEGNDVAATDVGNKTLNVYGEGGSKTGTKTLKELRLSPGFKLNPGATRYIYVTFEMETIPENIINVADTEETKKNKIKVNIVEVSSYGTYHALDGLNSTNINSYNEHPIGTNAGLVDFKSMPENVDGIKETGVALKPYVPNVHEWDDSIAFVKFVEKQERTLSGNVWIENRNKEESNANIGNGIKEDGEAGYEGVRVQLYDNETNAIAKTHWEDTDGDGKLDWSDAPTLLTDANGDYGTFKGISPGDYYLLFTYPDGQTYKSTIFGGGAINTDTPDSNDGVNFDIDADSTNTDASNAYKFLSHARDKMGDESTAKTRKYVNNLLASVGEINEYKAGTEAQKVATNYETYIANNQGLDKEIAMEAITGHLIVGFETDPTKLNSNVGVEYTDITKLDSTTWEFTREFDLPKVNFGVVERPKSQLQLSKNVSYVRLVLGTGEILFDTSERSTNVSWVAAKKYVPQYDRNILQAIDIPAFRAIESNKGRVSMTADEEMLQGARLRIRYNIKVANIGEVDYDDNGFYYLGNAPADPDSSIVKTTIREVVDYAGYQGGSDDHVTRNNLKYEVEDNTGLDWVETNVANLMDPNGEKLADEIAYGVNEDGTAKTASDTNLRGASLYATILTNNMGETALKPQIVGSDYETAKDLTLTRKFNPNESEDDFTYNNLAEIISLQNGVGRRTQYSTVGNQDPENDLTKPDEATSEVDADHSEEVTLMGPYGQERYYGIIAIAASVIVIGAIVAAVIIVKRKKQNNNEE